MSKTMRLPKAEASQRTHAIPDDVAFVNYLRALEYDWLFVVYCKRPIIPFCGIGTAAYEEAQDCHIVPTAREKQLYLAGKKANNAKFGEKDSFKALCECKKASRGLGLYWIALQNSGGHWKWPNDMPPTFLNWRGKEPDKCCGRRVESAVANYRGKDGKWDSTGCE
uniref:C-type lectin domain-containing protein n=1 Tax=Ascaris lumbricoides TaxID=6252 RepID=A0A0M3IDB2_ASCLU